MALKVKEMLQRPFFEHATVLAGSQGLNRQVSWVHIIEIEKFGHLLNGQEVILTTGVGWADDEEKSLSYLQQLLDHNASALCIELVVHVQTLPQKMLELAEAHQFPIISFSEEVRFIDITKDLHEQIIGHQNDFWMELENLYQSMNQVLISNGGIGDFLRILHQETNKNIALTYHGQYRFFPSPSAKKQEEWKLLIDDVHHNEYYSHPIYIMNNRIGSLIFLEPLHRLTKFDELALKRCSEILQQFFWSHHRQMEIKQMENNKWMLDAIEGNLPHEEISRMIQQNSSGILLYDAVVGVKSVEKSFITEDRQGSSETRFIMAFRPILQQHGFELFTVEDHEQHMCLLLIMNQQTDSIQPRLESALHQFRNKNKNYLGKELPQIIGFGKIFSNYEEIGKSYHAAVSTLHYQQKMGILDTPFYNELGIYRLIDQIQDHSELTSIINDYLKPLIESDQEKGTELVKTLEVYLESLGRKNETAQKLHVVRQTLYHRLNKIEQLLGSDYMLPENRFMIEFAIHALKYVS